MSPQRRVAALLAALTLAGGPGCRGGERASPDQLRAEIAALETERDALRERLQEAMGRDPRLQGMPDNALRIGVPTSLARELVEKLVTGFADQVTLELRDLDVRKSGSVKKVVTLGEYALDVRIHEVRARLKAGRPDVRFGGDQVHVALPVTLASGSGRATVTFDWHGRSVGGAVCGDLHVVQEVTGGVKPASYPVRGRLELSAGADRILARPGLPPLEVNLAVVPSAASWAAVQKVLDDQRGVCGFVLDHVDVMALVRGIVERGFSVRLPTERLRPVGLPVGLEPRLSVRGQPVALSVKVGALAITEQVIWLGADVALAAR